MLVVGLTGVIGSGKTMVATLFEKKGVTIIDADKISRDLTIKNSPCYQKIIAHFGETILLSNQKIDRSQLRQKIFNSPKQKKWLENLLHPLIMQRMEEMSRNASGAYSICVIPLLKNKKQFPFLNRILVIDCNPELSLQRIIERDHLSREEALKIQRAQIDQETRLALADDVILNDNGANDLQQKIDQLHLQYLDLSKNGDFL